MKKNLAFALFMLLQLLYVSAVNVNAASNDVSAETSQELSAKFLISEIGKNQMRFDKHYKNKSIVFEGFVGDITEKNNQYILDCSGEIRRTRPFDYIECRFDLSEEDALIELNKGEIVKIEGFYKGKEQFQVGAIVLHDCKILK